MTSKVDEGLYSSWPLMIRGTVGGVGIVVVVMVMVVVVATWLCGRVGWVGLTLEYRCRESARYTRLEILLSVGASTGPELNWQLSMKNSYASRPTPIPSRTPERILGTEPRLTIHYSIV